VISIGSFEGTARVLRATSNKGAAASYLVAQEIAVLRRLAYKIQAAQTSEHQPSPRANP
jgi:hypothetical protein